MDSQPNIPVPGKTDHASEEIQKATPKATAAVVEYLRREAPEFQRLSELRQKNQRRNADKADTKTAHFFYKMMRSVADEMDRETDAFWIPNLNLHEQHILDLCMAPGGYLSTALRVNPTASALAFTLPQSKGGHGVLLPLNSNSRVTLKSLDITMLAGDMGMLPDTIPEAHPDADSFILASHFTQGQSFDLALCDGQVLRTHERAAYRGAREATRLITTQLALALEHLKPRGTLVLLLHKADSIHNVRVLYTFAKFASLRLFKPKKAHATRSSFNLVASGVRSDCEEAVQAVKKWKEVWKIATFGTDEMYREVTTRLGREIWKIQVDALEKAPYVKNARSS
ncbi:hypothetical protein BJX70DRAFT_406818 [Aspergillus crustosus]